MNSDELLDCYMRIQTSLIGVVTPSLFAVSFSRWNEDVRMMLVYLSPIREFEQVAIQTLEDRLSHAFQGKVRTEIVEIQEPAQARYLEFRVFRVSVR